MSSNVQNLISVHESSVVPDPVHVVASKNVPLAQLPEAAHAVHESSVVPDPVHIVASKNVPLAQLPEAVHAAQVPVEAS